MTPSRPPVVVDRLLDDPGLVRDLVRRGGPYGSVQRYTRNLTEVAALTGAQGQEEAPMLIVPWFRGDWLGPEARLEGLEPIVDNPRLHAAARAVFGGRVVRPILVYANLNPPIPALDPGHVDIPAFRGVDRTRHPAWLLTLMAKSGLFERWHVPVATAVAWYYEGEGGGFRYWPDGPSAPPVDRECVPNSAVVGDNDRMFHCIHRVGPLGANVRMDLTLDAQLHVRGDRLVVEDGGRELERYAPEDVRVSVSWKAIVFADEAEERRFDDHADDLALDEVEAIFVRDLRARGIPFERTGALLTDDRFIRTLTTAHHVAPTTG